MRGVVYTREVGFFGAIFLGLLSLAFALAGIVIGLYMVILTALFIDLPLLIITKKTPEITYTERLTNVIFN